MEDADQILLTSLRQAGCDISDDVTSLGDLSTGDLFTICQQSVRQIEGLGKEGIAKAKKPGDVRKDRIQHGVNGDQVEEAASGLTPVSQTEGAGRIKHGVKGVQVEGAANELTQGLQNGDAGRESVTEGFRQGGEVRESENGPSVNGGTAGAFALGLPKDTAARFRACAEMAVKLQQLGYRGELSFHQFLYPSDSDTRNLVRFLVEKLAANRAVSHSSTRKNRVSARFLSALRASGATPDGPSSTASSSEGGNVAVPHRSQPLAIGMNKQKGIYVFGSKGFVGVRPQHVPSGKEEGADNLEAVRGGVETLRVEGGGAESANAEALALQERYDSAAAAMDGLRQRMEEMELEYRRLGQEAEGLEEATVELEEEYLLRKETAEFVLSRGEEAGVLSAELQRSIEKAHERRRGLELEWAGFVGPLEERRDELKGIRGPERESIKAREEEIRKLQAECRELETGVRDREEQQEALLAELESAPKGVPGAVYVRRITDVGKQVRKQDAEILKILADVREVQRRNNADQDRLLRTYATVDEKIFREAKRDQACKAAYRLLCSIHQSFSELVGATTEQDRVSREVADLEAKVRGLRVRSLDSAKLEEDLRAIKQENGELEARLRGNALLSFDSFGPLQ